MKSTDSITASNSERLDLKKYILLVFIFFSTLTCFGKTYFVDCENGDDSNEGTSIELAWKSLSVLKEFKFNPGDIILLKRGCVWNESMIFKSSGTSKEYIIIDTYGGSDALPTLSGSVFKSVGTKDALPNKISNQIYIEDKLYIGGCDNPSNTLSDKFGYSAESEQTLIEYLEMENGIRIEGDYVQLRNIKVTKFKSVGVKITGIGVIVTGCEIIDIPRTGLQFVLSDSSEVSNSKFRNIGYDSKPCCVGAECGHLGNGIFISVEKNKDKTVKQFTKDIRIIGNEFIKVGTFSGDHGVYDNGHNTMYINNTFARCSGTGIKLDGEDAFIFNNLLDSCVVAGILIDGGNGHEVLNNSLLNCGLMSGEWGRQGAIWYIEKTKQIEKHPTPGGATIKFNLIKGGDIALKISNSYDNLDFLDNVYDGQKLRKSNIKEVTSLLTRTDSVMPVDSTFKSKLYETYNLRIQNNSQIKVGRLDSSQEEN